MMHLSRLRPQRNVLAGRLVTASAVKDFSRVHELSSSAGFVSNSAVIRRDDDRVFANHAIFKGKAALSLRPISPKFVQADSGIYVKKPGSVLLSFWPAIGTRKYDWQKRQAISLSSTEVGSLISLSSGESCEFCHDTSKIESMSSQALKRLAVKPLPEGGHMFHLSVTDIVQKINDRFSVPVTKAEFAVIRTACSYFLPHMIGWDIISSQGKRMLTSPASFVIHICFLNKPVYPGSYVVPLNHDCDPLKVLKRFTSQEALNCLCEEEAWYIC